MNSVFDALDADKSMCFMWRHLRTIARETFANAIDALFNTEAT